MKRLNDFEKYQEKAVLNKAALVALYDQKPAAYFTAIKYGDKNNIKENEKAARVLHYYKYNAVNFILEKIDAGGLECLSVPEMFFIKNCFNESITDGSGKMTGLQSISTAVFLNSQCLKNRRINGSICQKCYAARYSGMRPALARKLEINTLLYCGYVVPVELLPEINCLFFRLESFGDIMNTRQQVNYFNLVNKNSGVRFAQWSKNPHIINDTIKAGYNKPDNLTIVYSALFLNMDDSSVLKVMEKYGFIDYSFIVYTPEYIKENGVITNCAGVRCLSCLHCYKAGNIKIIREKLK